MEVAGIYLQGVDAATAGWYDPRQMMWIDLASVSGVRAAGSDTGALTAERERLLARLAEIDAALARVS
jgi:hypothetical protein